MSTTIVPGLYQGKKSPHKYFQIIRVDLKKKQVTISLGFSQPDADYRSITRVKSFGWVKKQLRKIE